MSRHRTIHDPFPMLMAHGMKRGRLRRRTGEGGWGRAAAAAVRRKPGGHGAKVLVGFRAVVTMTIRGSHAAASLSTTSRVVFDTPA